MRTIETTISIQILTYFDYETASERLEYLLQRTMDKGGFESLNEAEEEELDGHSEAVAKFEDEVLKLTPLKAPETLEEMLKFKMLALRLKQKEMASILDIPASRLSEILTGKRKVSLELAKKMRDKLMIDANFILDHAPVG